jgi:BTB/POZ domain
MPLFARPLRGCVHARFFVLLRLWAVQKAVASVCCRQKRWQRERRKEGSSLFHHPAFLCIILLYNFHHFISSFVGSLCLIRTMTSLPQQDELRNNNNNNNNNKPRSDHDQDEPSRDGALRSLLTREDLSDVTLRGSDGILVLANRNILARRSSVFFGMLYGPFKEASNPVVDVGYEGKVLQAIVSYMRTPKKKKPTTRAMNIPFRMTLVK